MQQRVMQNRKQRQASMRQIANQLLELRARTHAKYGSKYHSHIEPYRPLVAIALLRHGCPRRAAEHVIELLRSQGCADTTATTFITCAALDLSIGETNLPLAS